MSGNTVPALVRAMAIVDVLAESGQEGMSVPDIAARTGIARSTTALLCNSLEEEGMARRYDGRYRLGRRFLPLAADYLASVDQLSEFYEEVRRLPIISRHAARLALLEGTEVIYLARYEGGGRGRRTTGGIGERFPASITATGKALLSTLPTEAVEDRFRDIVFPKFTERSIASLPGLLNELRVTRGRGWAIDDEETNLGQVCYSVPVVDSPGEAASFAVSTTMTKEATEKWPAEVIVSELNTLAEVFRNPLAAKTY